MSLKQHRNSEQIFLSATGFLLLALTNNSGINNPVTQWDIATFFLELVKTIQHKKTVSWTSSFVNSFNTNVENIVPQNVFPSPEMNTWTQQPPYVQQSAFDRSSGSSMFSSPSFRSLVQMMANPLNNTNQGISQPFPQQRPGAVQGHPSNLGSFSCYPSELVTSAFQYSPGCREPQNTKDTDET